MPNASLVYKARFGAEGHCNRDINTVETNEIPDHDLLVGGFPCQDYSVASTLSRSGGIEGKKGVLWWQIYRILKEKGNKRPKYVFFANAQSVSAEVAGACNGCFKGVLIEAFWIKQVCLGMNLFARMSPKLKFAAYNILDHLEYAFLHLVGVSRRFDILTQLYEVILLYFLLCAKEQLPLAMSICNILVNIDSDENAYLFDAVKEWSKRSESIVNGQPSNSTPSQPSACEIKTFQRFSLRILPLCHFATLPFEAKSPGSAYMSFVSLKSFDQH